MKKTIFAFVLLVAFASTAWGQTSFDGNLDIYIGGGFYWDDKLPRWSDRVTPNFHISANVLDTGPISYVPFYEYASKRDFTTSLYGLNLYGRLPLWEDRLEVYLGPGFGGARKNGVNAAHVGFTAGARYTAHDWLGLFFQVKYAWTDKDLFEGVGGYGGLSFNLAELFE